MRRLSDGPTKLGLTRRAFLAATALGGVSLAAGRLAAEAPTLRILQWKHFVPGYDEWFDSEFVPDWANRNGANVVVDHAGLSDIESLAVAEAKSGKGHDMVMLQSPVAIFEDAVVDHGDIYRETIRRFGPVQNFAGQATYNPKTKRHFAFCTAYQPAVSLYRQSLWDAFNAKPNTWDDVRNTGRRIKLLHNKPVGISLGQEHNAEQTMRAILGSFGGSVQDTDGNPALASRAAIEAVKYLNALYKEAMPADVIGWNPTSNNTLMLTGECSMTIDTMSIPRAGEAKNLPVARDIWLAGVPEGPAGRMAPSFGVHLYFIWKHARHVELAKQFLVDYIGASRTALLASGFQNMPSFPATVPELKAIVSNNPQAFPADKYAVLADAGKWTTNIGFPGFDNAAVSEIYEQRIISRMFASAATGRQRPNDAVADAGKQVSRIFSKWRSLGKI